MRLSVLVAVDIGRYLHSDIKDTVSMNAMDVTAKEAFDSPARKHSTKWDGRRKVATHRAFIIDVAHDLGRHLARWPCGAPA